MSGSESCRSASAGRSSPVPGPSRSASKRSLRIGWSAAASACASGSTAQAPSTSSTGSARSAKATVDLARASLAVAREEYPDLDDEGYLRKLDELAAQVQKGMPAGASPERRVGRLNSVLFHDLGFDGNREDYYDPKNSFLNEV